VGTVENLGLAADHEGEARRFRPRYPARHRRVEHVEPRPLRSRRHSPRGFDIDRRTVDQQCAAAGAGENAAVLEIDRAHLRAGRQHRDHDVTRGGSLGSRFGRPAAFCNKRLDGRRHEVETDHLMPGLQEIGRHRRPIFPSPMNPIVAIPISSSPLIKSGQQAPLVRKSGWRTTVPPSRWPLRDLLRMTRFS
jgi:hypothetical protein